MIASAHPTTTPTRRARPTLAEVALWLWVGGGFAAYLYEFRDVLAGLAARLGGS